MKILTLEIYFFDKASMHYETYTINAFTRFQLIKEFLRVTDSAKNTNDKLGITLNKSAVQRGIWNEYKNDIKTLDIKFPHTIIGSVDYLQNFETK